MAFVADDKIKVHLLNLFKGTEEHLVGNDHHSANSLFQELDWPILLDNNENSRLEKRPSLSFFTCFVYLVCSEYFKSFTAEPAAELLMPILDKARRSYNENTVNYGAAVVWALIKQRPKKRRRLELESSNKNSNVTI